MSHEIFSRVGCVWKRDSGGPHTFLTKWTCFAKAQQNCSVPGSYHFYFNQIQDPSPESGDNTYIPYLSYGFSW